MKNIPSLEKSDFFCINFLGRFSYHFQMLGAHGSLFAGWRHPAMGMASMAGMDLTQAAYRYNHNMMEYYTCK